MAQQPEKFHLGKRLRSFRYAFNGLRLLFRLEHNSRIHLVAAVIVVAGGVWFGVSLTHWALLILAIGLVFGAELFNSAIEKIVDHISPEYSERAGHVKDMAAAAVLVSVLTAIGIGLAVFIPYL